MNILLQSEAPPLRLDDAGVIRVGDSRVPLELVIEAFQDGAAPETIVDLYPTTRLADIYSIIGLYLDRRAEIHEYIATRRRQADAVREKITAEQGDLSEIRERILARHAARPQP